MKNLVLIGHLAFLIGMILAILAAFLNIPMIATLLFLFGIIVGFLNITEKESTPFLVAMIALLLASTSVLQADVAIESHKIAQDMLSNLISFISASAFVVALKQVFSMAKSSE